MGFKQHKNTPPFERELNYLLYDLCVKYGFCIPLNDADEISQSDRITAEEFAIKVVKAESMEPELDYHWVKKISERFRQRFGSEEIVKDSFVDRVRGIKESW